jgi:hypothetical protein
VEVIGERKDDVLEVDDDEGSSIAKEEERGVRGAVMVDAEARS